MSVLWRAFDRIVDAMAILAGVILLLCNAAVCYGIAMRYFFSAPSIWVLQGTEYGLLWIVFLATTWLLREKGHVNVDIIYGHLGEGAKRGLDVVMYSIAGLTCAVVFVMAVLYVRDCVVNSVTDVRAVTVPKWTVFFVIPWGSFFLTMQLFRMAWGRATDRDAEKGA